jgi:outer membrane protein OmpA-like peptidoglycan-associated protein
VEAAPREPSQDRQRADEPAVAGEGRGTGAPGLMLDAQARLGNQGATALARRMGRSGSGGHGGLREGALAQPDGLTAVLARRVMDPSNVANASFADADAFKGHGPFGPTDVIEGTGGTGGFEAMYDPAGDQLNVVMRCGVNFRDAMDASGTPADTRLAGLATAMPPPGPARTAYIKKYQWDPAEKAPWLTQLKSSVETVWSAGGRFEFFVNQTDWEWVGAKVKIDIQVHEVLTSGGNDHLTVENFKFPPGENLYSVGDFSETGPGAADNAQDQTMRLASTDVLPRPDQALRWDVNFDLDSDDVSKARVTLNGSPSSMGQFVITFNGATAGTPGRRPPKLELVGHASQSGDDTHNLDLSKRRAANVQKALKDNGFRDITTRVASESKGEEGANPVEDPKDRRVDIIVDGGDAQILAAHEFGHAFGLDDQYAVDPGGRISGTGGATGSASSHQPQTQAMTDASGKHLEGSVHENNADIMSMGNKVGAQHYSMFHAALCELTGMTNWALGPKKARPATSSTGAPPAAPTTPPAPGP